MSGTTYTNLMMYSVDRHQVRLTFFDQRQIYEGTTNVSPAHKAAEQVAELVMTRQTFRVFLEIWNGMAQQLPPILVATEDQPPLPEPSVPRPDPMNYQQAMEWLRENGLLLLDEER